MDHSVPTTSNQEGPKDPKEYIRALLLTMYYEQSEHLHSDFSEAYLKFRQVVCEWIVDVCEYFNLHITTTHAAICYLDRLQPNEKFSRFEWQMMAVCCIIIASKYNECEEHVPPLQKLGEITQQTIGNDILLEYELFSLKRMAWKLNVRSTMAFLCSYDELGLFSNSDIDTLNNLAEAAPADSQDENSVPSATKVNTLLRAMRHKVYKLGSKTLLDSRFKSFQSSAVASAVVFYARRCCCLSSPFGSALPAWTDELTKMTFHHPLRHRATTQALELIFEMEGESVEELRALIKADEKPVSNILSFDKETSYDDFISLSESSPVKRDSPASAVLVSPIATTSATGKDIDFSPVSMTTVFNTISP